MEVKEREIFRIKTSDAVDMGEFIEDMVLASALLEIEAGGYIRQTVN